MNCVNKTLVNTTAKLKKFSTSASLDSEVLLSHILKKNKAWLLTHPEHKLNCWQKIKYQILVYKRIHNWPIAYLIGWQEFYKLKFKINKHTLIPRPESELFIDELKKINPVNQTIADIGTGSGCLIITAAKLFPNNKFTAVDISKPALKIARHNANQHDVNIKFIKNNLLDKFESKNFSSAKNYLPFDICPFRPKADQPLAETFDIIMANLPYLRPEEMEESSIQKEPKLALLGGINGLEYYQQLFKQIKNLTHPPQYILCEINPQQINNFNKLAQNNLPKYKIQTRPDLSGQTRLIILQQNH